MTTPPERGGDPENAGLIKWGGVTMDPFGVQMYEAAGSPQGMQDWWLAVAVCVRKYGGTLHAAVFLSDLLANVRNAGDPVLRQSKGVGELTNPGGFMYSRCKRYVQERGGTVPPYRGR